MAKICFEVESNDAIFSQSLAKEYRHFLSAKNPDLKIKVEFHSSEESSHKNSKQNLESESLSKIKEVEFKLLKENVYLACDPVQNLFLAKLPNFDRDINEAIFNAYILPLALHQIVRIRELSYFLVHASAVAFKGQGYIFVGPSGSGKSTVTELTLRDSDFEGEVLNDELVVLSNSSDKCMVFGTPLGNGGPKLNLGVPIKAIFGLKHNKKVFLEKLNPMEATAMIMSQTLPHLDLEHLKIRTLPDFCSKSPSIAENWLGEALIITKKIPCYNLHFAIDLPFWHYLKDL